VPGCKIRDLSPNEGVFFGFVEFYNNKTLKFYACILGDFERHQPEKYRPAERPEPVKQRDNLKPEGDFDRPTKEKFVPAERPKQKRPEDNLRPEGKQESIQ